MRFKMPSLESLTFYTLMVGCVTAEVIAWPVALAVGVGHLLASSHNPFERGLGEVLEDA